MDPRINQNLQASIFANVYSSAEHDLLLPFKHLIMF